MTEFDYSQYDNDDDYTTVDAIYDMIHQADKLSRPMSILLECYNKYENHTSEADAIANDKEALDWLDDYWEYVCMVEHGNQGSIEEIGGFKGMAETITDPYIAEQVIEYLQNDDDVVDEETQNLIDRLKQITARYNGVNKMKKSANAYCSECGAKVVVLANNTAECKNCGSLLDEDEIIFESDDKSMNKSIPSIHEMIAQTRANNNSLVKSRVDMKKEFLTNDLDKYDDIGYMAEACANEMDSVFNAINETSTENLEFRCSPDEYYQKLVECKRNIDWLVDNINVWIR